jgi:pyruvate,water dikinase
MGITGDWLPLSCFLDAAVPKLDVLRRAAAAGLRVPPTCWQYAAVLDPGRAVWPDGFGDGPLIVRSGSPTEDGRTTSHAGQFLSLMVPSPTEFTEAVRRVVEALPPGGAVFVQPVVRADEAGVAFFDGFYYERTLTRSFDGKKGALNVELTGGQARGAVTRSHLERGEAWSEWLTSVYAVFGPPRGDRRLDVEWARVGPDYVLLQVRPALFPLRRNETLTQANLKETLGVIQSPWTASAMVEGSRGLTFLHYVDPVFAQWEEDFAVELAGRLWINVTVWYRFLDALGLPRTMLSQMVGGLPVGPADGLFLPGQMLRRAPRLLSHQWLAWRAVATARRVLAELGARIDAAHDLPDLYRATVRSWETTIHTAMAIAGLCSMVLNLRRILGISGAAHLITQDLMEDYRRLGDLPDAASREAGLDAWLARHGHRGPAESDVARPRFAELRAVLLGDLLRQPFGAAVPDKRPSLGRRLLHKLLRPFYLIDERREWFRSECMRLCQRLRARILEEGARLVAAGRLDAPDDVFWLRGGDLSGAGQLREAVSRNRAAHEAVRHLDLPLTATREEIEAAVANQEREHTAASGQRVFLGVPLSPAVLVGVARKADDLVTLLAGGGKLGPDIILVVPALEPSWAVVFPRVGGVVAEAGGELSHASILLREAGKPALVNVPGVFHQVSDGDRLRLDGRRGVVEVLGNAAPRPRNAGRPSP